MHRLVDYRLSRYAHLGRGHEPAVPYKSGKTGSGKLRLLLQGLLGKRLKRRCVEFGHALVLTVCCVIVNLRNTSLSLFGLLD